MHLTQIDAQKDVGAGIVLCAPRGVVEHFHTFGNLGNVWQRCKLGPGFPVVEGDPGFFLFGDIIADFRGPDFFALQKRPDVFCGHERRCRFFLGVSVDVLFHIHDGFVDLPWNGILDPRFCGGGFLGFGEVGNDDFIEANASFCPLCEYPAQAGNSRAVERYGLFGVIGKGALGVDLHMGFENLLPDAVRFIFQTDKAVVDRTERRAVERDVSDSLCASFQGDFEGFALVAKDGEVRTEIGAIGRFSADFDAAGSVTGPLIVEPVDLGPGAF